jgi:Tol biopolymer transport system component
LAAVALAVPLAACSSVPQPRLEPTPVATEVLTSRPETGVNRIAVIDGDVVYTVDPDGNDTVTLNQSGSIPSAALAWSVDGRHIAFTIITGDHSELVTVDAQGQNRASIYRGDHADAPFYLYWSPDNEHIAFLRPDSQNGLALQIAPANGKLEQPIARGQPNYFSWSPGGEKLALHLGDTQGFVGTFQLGEADVLRSESEPAIFQAPAWSPAGDAYLFARDGGSGPDELMLARDGNETTLVTYTGRIAFAWSPDGTRVAYSVSNNAEPHYASLTVIDADGSHPRKRVDVDHVAYFWSPDGKHIAFLTTRRASPDVIGQAPSKLAAPRIEQSEVNVELAWHVVDVETGKSIDVAFFRPTGHFMFTISFFDQYAQSITFWSPDSHYLLFAGRPLGQRSAVYRVDATVEAGQATRVGPGEFAVWSWR